MERYPVALKSSPADRSPTLIANRVALTANMGTLNQNIQSTPCGALGAGVYKSILTLNTPGVLKFCAAASTLAADLGLKIVIDGGAVFDGTVSVPSAGRGICAVGWPEGGSYVGDRVPFNSLQVYVKSSVAGTDNVITYIAYDLVAP